MITTFALLVGLMAPSTGQLIVDTSPSSASIYVDGKKANAKPGKAFTVPAGRRKVTAKRSGYSSATKTVLVKKGGTTRVKLTLKKGSSARGLVGGKTVVKRPTKFKRPTK